MAIGIGTTVTLTYTNEETSVLSSALGLISGDSSKPENIIAQVDSEKESKIKQQKDVKNLLVLTDLTLDGYDQTIINIDKKLPDLVDPLNAASVSLASSYQSRIAAGCLSDLTWTLTQEIQRIGTNNGGITTTLRYQYWEVIRDPSQFVPLNYYGLKYYRRPRNIDYGAAAGREIKNGSVGLGSTSLVIFDTEGSTGITIGDIILDDVESPYIFDSKDLPTVIGIGTTSTSGIVTSFVGNISSGSSILRQTGSGSISGLSTGQYINRSGITTYNTRIVGFGTTSSTITIVDQNGNSSITTSTVSSIILSQVAIASTIGGTFTAEQFDTYYILGMSTSAQHAGVNTNFFVIKNTPLDPIEFDFSKNSASPIQIGLIKSPSQFGYGHTLSLINNGVTTETTTWNEFVDSEPPVGAGFTGYYVGAPSWPTIKLSGITTYAPLGTKVTIALAPNENQTSCNFTSTSPIAISTTACAAYASTISSTQSTYDDLVSTNVPLIERYIGISSIVRGLRDEKEILAWSFERALGSLNVEVAKLTKNLELMQSIDFAEFEDT